MSLFVHMHAMGASVRREITKLCFARWELFNNKNDRNSYLSSLKTRAHIFHQGKVDFRGIHLLCTTPNPTVPSTPVLITWV